MKASEIMTPDPTCCLPDETLQKAAQLMLGQDCGCLPVVDDRATMRIIGTVTDRDLAVRALARGKGPDTIVEDVMSTEPSCCLEDDDLRDVERVMEERQVRRVPVIDRQGRCIGIIAQADLALHRQVDLDDTEVAEVVERVSRPSEHPRSDSDIGRRQRI